ncbi:MAG: transcription antitermination factor NusB [Planctomycetota bacterium]|nr:MAG: transcription antitermination factor NusB [Planctomycetota bacterium]
MAPVRRRTRARELALQFLFMLELRGSEAMEELVPFVEHHTKGSRDKKGRGELAEFTLTLARGVVENRVELDQWIEAIAKNWRMDRMAHLDRNVLRLAVYELIFQTDTPYKVIINEAIDIAKRFSTAQSGSFVNGILDRARVMIDEARETPDSHPAPPQAKASADAGSQSNSQRGPMTVADPIPFSSVPVPRPKKRTAPTDGRS